MQPDTHTIIRCKLLMRATVLLDAEEGVMKFPN